MTSPQPPIAIVGISAQLPSGETALVNLDHKQFSDFLLDKGEAYERIPIDRFNIDSYLGKDAGQVSTERGTFLKHTEQIDHVELGITSKDAKAMSVSTRKLIELSFLALLDSGIDYRGQNVGCFASGIVFDVLSLSEPDEFEARGSFSGPPAMIANRVSYHLDLVGPSVPVDTACSSSVTATHLAVQSIRSGDCDAAVVAGIQLNHRFVDWVQYSQGGILAPDGKCKPFDVSANGFARGEAGVAIVLKRLDLALKDRDYIYGTILGTGINSAGSAAPVNAPVAMAQRDAMRRAWSQTCRQPSEVDFVELHATGTAAGDPAEANWVGEAFHREDELIIGSVKGNIGHTEIASFLVSLIKAVNIFHTGIIPPNVNFFTPNPLINWDKYRLHVPTQPVQLPCHSNIGLPLISLCSSGIGGANGHVVLEAPPVPSGRVNSQTEGQNAERPLLLVSGALSPRSTITISETISELIIASPERSQLVSTLYGRRTRQMTWRSYAVCTSGQTSKAKFSEPVLCPRIKPKVVFVFAGQGPQHLDMGRELFQIYPSFRKSILEMDQVYAQKTGMSLIATTGLFYKESIGENHIPLGDLWPIEVTLPALAMLQCALVDLLESVGVSPDIVVGHSAGETSLLYASKAGSKAMVVELAIARGKAMASIESADGTMAAVSCSIADAHSLIVEALEPWNRKSVDVGCHNSQEAVTLSGRASSIEKVVVLAESRGIMARKLKTRVPVHSNMMDLCHAEFKEQVEKMWLPYPGALYPQLPVYSTVTGKLLDFGITSEYYWDGTRGPVLFTEAITALLEKYPTATFMEISPHPVLSSYLSALGATTVVAPLRRPKRNEMNPVEATTFLDCLGKVTMLGHNFVDFSALNDHPALDNDCSLPSYPFNTKAVPYHSESVSFYRQFQNRKGPLNHSGLRINSQTHPVLAQHVIKGEPIMPASGFIEMALEFGAMVLWDVAFRTMMSLSGESPVPVQVSLDGIHWTVKTAATSLSATTYDTHFDKIHAEGFLSLESPKVENKPLNLDDILGRCQRIDLTHFYEDLKTFAEYGPEFQRVIDGYQGENEVLVLVRGDDDLLDVDGYVFHPAILDCCLHFMVHKSFTLNNDGNIYYLPSKVGKLTLHQAFVELGLPDEVYVHIVFRSWTPLTLVADFNIVTLDGTQLCTLTQVEVERHESSPRLPVSQRHDLIFQPLAVPAITIQSHDIDETPHENMRNLYVYLDSLATEAIITTLQNKPVAGKSIDRQRYLNFSTAVAAAPIISAEPFEESFVSEIHHKWPDLIKITERVASVHSEILKSSKAAVEVLYKDDIMTRYYQHYDWASEACAGRLRRMLSSMIESGKRVIRVLEVGAGTGALTRHLAKVMEEFSSAIIQFVVSDVSTELLPRIPYGRCRYMAFDISKPPKPQGLDLASFDVITAFNVLHVVEDLASSLDVLGGLLVPGGCLLIGDLNGDSWKSRAPGSIWFDFIFGSFAEWFSYTDDRSHCTISPQDWHRRLHIAGFENVYTAEFSSDPLLFTLEAQKSLQLPLDVSTIEHHNNELVVLYQQGTEGQVREKLSTLDAFSTTTIWFYAVSGFHGDAGIGFFRSLGREYPLWDIHLVIFDGPLREHEHLEFVYRLSRIPGLEALLRVDEGGTISVSRVVPSAAPSGEHPFQPSLPWTLTDTELVQMSLAPRQPNLVTVEVLAMSRREANLRTFVGRISSPVDNSCIVANKLVVGLVSSPGISNFITVHYASLAFLPDAAEELAADIAGAALGILIGCLACRASDLRSSRRRRGGSALLFHGSDVVGPSLKWILRLLEFEVIEVKSNSIAYLAERATEVDLFLSGSDDNAEIQAFTQALTHKCRSFLWNDSRDGLESILKKDPASIGDALELAVEFADQWPHSNIGLRLSDISISGAGTHIKSSASLFDSNKAYLLVGGIGGLGMRVALWMYEKGARYLVLTSRSGRESLSRVQDRLALRIMAYMESLPELTIRLEASDATSKKATIGLLRSIPRHLGGCMLLSAVLSDRTFASQEDESFRKVFASKTGACSVLNGCLPGGIEALDFFISFSSVVGLFGNGGQTNYSSANTALDGMVRNWENAFTFVLPAVTDGGGLASETGERGGRLGHLTPWGMSSQQICDSLEDGIRKLADGPFWQYIPNLDWNLVHKHLGSSALFEHLIHVATDDSPRHTENTAKSMMDVVIELLDVDPSEFSSNVPFTAYGLDSLSAARLAFALRPYVTISQLQLLSDVSLHDLQVRVETTESSEVVQESPSILRSPELSQTEAKVAEMETLIAKYTRAFPKHVGSGQFSSDNEVILITGTTGAIGTSMLAQMVDIPSVTRIYAFNRKGGSGSGTLRERQVDSLRQRGYDPEILKRGKIVMVEGDQSKPDLGISARLYQEIRSSVTVIIHNAWPVNFTASLASMEPSIYSVRVFIDLALRSSLPCSPRLLFLSSIGLFYNRTGTGPAVEGLIKNGKQVIGTGYSESKWVGERILEQAAEETTLRPVIVRAGQICGGINGQWSTTEWFPTLVKSSLHLGALPGGNGDVSWIPLHTAAQALIDMRDADQQVVHLSHPRPVPWSRISEFLSKTLNVPLIPYQDWLTRLEESAGNSGDITRDDSNPALRLLQYFRDLEVGKNAAKEALGLPKLSVVEGMRASASLRAAEPLTRMNVASWINSWERAGFLKTL